MSKRITKYSIEYWINKGFSSEDAKLKINEFKFKQRKNNPICLEYWTNRGYSSKEAKVKIYDIQKNRSEKRKNKYTPNQIIFWIQQGYSEEESKILVQKNIEKTNILKKDFWIRKGYTEKESTEKIRNIQSENSKKVKRRRNGRTIEKYINLGLCEEQAKKELFNIQRVGAIDKFIERYGELEGTKKWEERQIKWRNTIDKNFPKEIQRKWGSFTYENYIKKYGKEKADIWLKKKIAGVGNTYSKISMELFNDISQKINGDFYFGDREYVLRRKPKWTYVLDFYDDKTKKIIEFNGDFWHANPDIYKETDINPYSKETAKEIWVRDKERIENIQKNSNGVLIIWESEYKKNPSLVLDNCINFLKDEKNNKNIKN